MAKNSVRDFDATAANNTDIQSVDIAENCAPSGINNAIRELMADIKDVSAGTVALESPSADSLTVTGDLTVDTDTLFVDASADAVGIGTTSPAEALHVYHPSANINAIIESGDANAYLAFKDNATSGNAHVFLGASGNDMTFFSGGATERMRIDSSGNVGINETAPTVPLEVKGAQGYASSASNLSTSTSTAAAKIRGSNDATTSLFFGALTNDAEQYIQSANYNGSAADTIALNPFGGDVLVGQTSGSAQDVGHIIQDTGLAFHTANGATPLYLTRKTNDGALLEFRKDTVACGRIHSRAGLVLSIVLDPRSNGAGLTGSTREIVPADENGDYIDNAVDLGAAGARFDDIYATNGTIQTSDQNEKQQIASLTDAEITAAKAISKLFKTFKWNDSVEAKGDAARTHAGVISQDVQSCMTDAGLDAGDYAFFISTTWWETQTDVPAIEAVAAQDAVLDDDGNVVTEAVEEVEARDAYTRTDIYKTADEAPEGATERTRLGIRYPELLAFIGAATEQRLTSIESRLTALEG